MTIRKDPRNGGWYYRKLVRLPSGRSVRIFGVPTSIGLPNTKAAAEEAERRHVLQAQRTGSARIAPAVPGDSPLVSVFAETFLKSSDVQNKPSTMDAKRSIIKSHITPQLGALRLDQVDYGVVEDFKAYLSSSKLAPKTVNNCLSVLHRMLSVAHKRGALAALPDFEWLRVEKPDFDFLTFDEATKLVDKAGEIRTMILVAIRTGLRFGELLGLRWDDVDLDGGRLMVRRNIVKGKVGTPKNGKPREIPLGDEVLKAIKGEKHLRGPLVFCMPDGAVLNIETPRWRLRSACKKAGLREVGWHALRHTFASHLAMRGAPLKAIQELMGHATIQMTMRYAHLSPEAARDAVRLLDGHQPKPIGSRLAADRKVTPK